LAEILGISTDKELIPIRQDPIRRPEQRSFPRLRLWFEGGDVAFGHRLKARLPAKRVPDAVERWIRNYEEKRNDGENFNDFVDRTGTEQFEELISDLKLPVEFNAENLLQFIDWNRSEPYKVERGEGECAV